jgi:hypothetical protein
MSGENAGGGISISAANGRKNVKPVEAGSSDDEAGVDIVFPPDYLHAASGPVVAKAGRHAPAAMPLMPAPACSSQANTQAALRNHGIEAKGSFHLNRVPEGRYLPGLTSAGDTEGPAAPTPAAIRSTRGTPQEVHHKRYITRGTSQEVHHKRYTRSAKSCGEAELPVTVKSDARGQVLEVPGPGPQPLPRPEAPALPALPNQPWAIPRAQSGAAMTPHRFTVYPE